MSETKHFINRDLNGIQVQKTTCMMLQATLLLHITDKHDKSPNSSPLLEIEFSLHPFLNWVFPNYKAKGCFKDFGIGLIS